MHDVQAFGDFQHFCDLGRDDEDVFFLQRSFGQPFGDGLPVHVFHGDVVDLVDRINTNVPDLDDIGVLELGRQLGFAQEAFAVVWIAAGNVRRQDFQGALPIQQRVRRQVDFAHAAIADQALDAVFLHRVSGMEKWLFACVW